MRGHGFAAAAVLLSMTFAFAARAETASNTIQASGSAQVQVSPDTASIEIGVVTANPITAVALRANSAEMTRVIAAIQKLGIPDSAIRTSNFSIEAQHPKDKAGEIDENRTIGYEVTNKVMITTTNLSKVGEIIDAAVSAGANSSNSVSFDLKNRAAIDDRVLADAVRNARHNAEIMATAEHAKVGRMISATNVLSFDDGAVAGYANRLHGVLGDATPAPILPGQLTISARVVVIFAIE
jgi:uncharacterized protein YggE